MGGKKVEAVQCKLPGAGLLAPSSSSVIRAIESVGDRMLIADHDGVIHGFKVSTAAGCELSVDCLLYTSDAADERSSVDLGGRRILKKKKTHREERKADDKRK